MTGKTYFEKLKDPRWQKKRLDVMNRAQFRCEVCYRDDKTLNVHHKIYRKGADPWEYANHELQCVCEDCHEDLTDMQKRLKEAIAKLGADDMEAVVGFAEGTTAVDYIRSCLPNKPKSGFSWDLKSKAHAHGFLSAILSSGAANSLMDRVQSTISGEVVVGLHEIDCYCGRMKGAAILSWLRQAGFTVSRKGEWEVEISPLEKASNFAIELILWNKGAIRTALFNESTDLGFTPADLIRRDPSAPPSESGGETTEI